MVDSIISLTNETHFYVKNCCIFQSIVIKDNFLQWDGKPKVSKIVDERLLKHDSSCFIVKILYFRFDYIYYATSFKILNYTSKFI